MSWNKEDVPKGYYVYKLIDPRDGLPYYVGKGVRKRAFYHLKEAISSTKSSAKLNRIRAIIAEGLEYCVEVVEDDLDQDTACALEISLINKFGRVNYDAGGILTNILTDTRQADFSKVVFRKGEDHHSFGKKRTIDATRKQSETCASKAKVLGTFNCICGCGVEMSAWRKDQQKSRRDKYGFADYHFDGAKHNYERSAIMKQLLESKQ